MNNEFQSISIRKSFNQQIIPIYNTAYNDSVSLYSSYIGINPKPPWYSIHHNSSLYCFNSSTFFKYNNINIMLSFITVSHCAICSLIMFFIYTWIYYSPPRPLSRLPTHSASAEFCNFISLNKGKQEGHQCSTDLVP